MDAEIAKKLRAAFSPEAVGKLPKVTCGNCSRDKQRKHCDQHQRSKCQTCRNYITTAHIDLDYVGHAAITDRLLQVDPMWSWEPVAFDQAGLPARDSNGGLWIRLTVAGVTRLGYGDAEGKTGPSAVKEAIGDALRNGAMRFGVGLDLWHKDGQLVQDTDAQVPAQREPAPEAVDPANQARADLVIICAENFWDTRKVAALYQDMFNVPLKGETNAHQIKAFTQKLFGISDDELKA